MVPAPNPVPTAESGPKLLEHAAWFDANWMWFSTAFFPISLLLICLLFSGSVKQKLDNPYVVGWLSATFYFTHHIEEHAYDFRGWRYAFVPNFNHGVGTLLFPECKEHITCPLYPSIGTSINVSAIWLGFVITMVSAHYLGPEYAYAGHVNWGMAVVNAGLAHLLPWPILGYNPGAVQSLFMFSFGVWALSRCGWKFATVCIVNGMAFHSICFGIGIKLLMKFGLPGELDGVLCFIMCWAVPLLLAKYMGPKLIDSEFALVPADDKTSGVEMA